MRRNLFWLSDEQWRKIEGHLPTDARGKTRVDTGVGLPTGIRTADDDLQSLCTLGRAWRMGAAVPGACRTRPIDRHADDRFDARQGPSLGLGRKKGEQR